jgi:CRISPR/Cas system CSM-associated protein Csm3 (group 7 of RAMP superfamily)
MNQIGIEATLELILRGPILVHSSAVGPWGVDAVALRDPAGHLIIPGDAVKGKVREA